jgi:hypothetical protein
MGESGMKIQIAVACDAAMQYNGQLCILGTFDRITSESMPITKRECAIVLQIVWNKIEEGPHNIKVQFMDEDGKLTLQDMESSFNLNVPEHAFFTTTNHIIHLQQVKFTRTGSYLVVAAIDGRKEAEIPLQVDLVKKEQTSTS